MGSGEQFRHKADDRPFRDYAILAGERRNELYEQYGAATPAGVVVGLKRVLPAAATTIETLPEVAKIRSLRLLPLLDFGTSEAGEVFLVTVAGGRTLRQRLGEGPMSPADGLSLLLDLVRALKTLEGCMPPPLAISPDNVILLPDGAQLDDYYLASVFAGARPLLWSLVSYAAPESDTQDADFRGALYSVGAVVFEALAGRPPFTGSPFEVIAAARTTDPDLGPLPENLRPIFAGLLARDRNARFPSPAVLLGAIGSETAVAAAGRSAAPAGVPPGSSLSAGTAGPAAGDLASRVGAASAPAGALRATAPPATPALVPLGRNPQRHEEFRREPDGAVMVKIPASAVRLGSDSGSPRECPVIEVQVPAFLIDKHPVIWARFLRQHQGHTPGSCAFCDRKAGVLPSIFLAAPSAAGKPTEIERTPALNSAIGPEHPVVCVTWAEADAYARSLGTLLPSEAEWETAYRAGSADAYYWGGRVDPECAWFVKNSGGATRPVGERRPNGAGLHDMAGNVSEYCRDAFAEDYYARFARGQPGAEGLIAAAGDGGRAAARSVRNGGWSMSEKSLTATFRVGYPPDQGSNVRGFRCVIGSRNAPDWARIAFEPA